jgi:hypothetical protein
MAEAAYKALFDHLFTTKPELLAAALEGLEQEELDAILTNIRDIEEDRKETLRRIELFTKSAKERTVFTEIEEQRHGKKKKVRTYNPPLSRLQVVKANFSGLGSELVDEHYVIVWDVKPNREQLVVIPTYSLKPSSVEKPNLFSIGEVPVLHTITGGNHTLVSVDQVTTISRKRIEVYEWGRKRAYINRAQEKRIKEAFRVYWLRKKTLYDIIRGYYQRYLPEFTDFNEQLSHLYRPVKEREWIVDRSAGKLIGLRYCFHDDVDKSDNPFWHMLNFKPMSSGDPTARDRLLYELINSQVANRANVLSRMKMVN